MLFCQRFIYGICFKTIVQVTKELKPELCLSNSQTQGLLGCSDHHVQGCCTLLRADPHCWQFSSVPSPLLHTWRQNPVKALYVDLTDALHSMWEASVWGSPARRMAAREPVSLPALVPSPGQQWENRSGQPEWKQRHLHGLMSFAKRGPFPIHIT